MAYTNEQLTKIYERTNGHCHICNKKLSFSNYGKLIGRTPWEVEHSTPKLKGGTDHLNNLYAACPACNRSKGTKSSRSVRMKNGFSKAPLSVDKIEKNKNRNSILLFGGILLLSFALNYLSSNGQSYTKNYN